MFQENLDLFLSDFGTSATCTELCRSTLSDPVGERVSTPLDNRRTFPVLFDEEYTPIEFGAEGHSITATTRTDLCTNVHHGDTLLIQAKTYRVIGIHPIMDGKFTELVLKDA